MLFRFIILHSNWRSLLQIILPCLLYLMKISRYRMPLCQIWLRIHNLFLYQLFWYICVVSLPYVQVIYKFQLVHVILLHRRQQSLKLLLPSSIAATYLTVLQIRRLLLLQLIWIKMTGHFKQGWLTFGGEVTGRLALVLGSQPQGIQMVLMRLEFFTDVLA